jgi:hypothetical protein
MRGSSQVTGTIPDQACSTPAGALKLPGDLLPVPEAKSRFQRDGLAALLVANLPPDMKKLRLWLDPLHINSFEHSAGRQPQGSGQVHVLSQSPRTDHDEVMDG